MTWWKGMFHRKQREDELDAELQDHLARQTDEYQRQGLDAAEARRRALADLGGLDAVKEFCRDRWRVRWLDDLWSDLRIGARGLAKRPAFTATATLTLLIGIGANTAMFSIVNGVLMRPLPYHESERLVLVGSLFEGRSGEPGPVSVGDFRQLRERARTLEDVVYAGEFSDVLLGDGDPEAVTIGMASAQFFEVFDGSAALGRLPFR